MRKKLFILALSVALPGGPAQAQPNSGGPIYSTPEPGQVRQEPPKPAEQPPPPEAPPPKPPTEIWSTPEPGRTREWYPPPPPNPPPHYYYYGSHWDDDHGEPLKEVGLTIGTPALINLSFGYWGSREFPLLLRFSGMYFGDTRGAQLDAGFVFHRSYGFRQYVALSAVSFQSSVDYFAFHSRDTVANFKEMFTGVGPTYGLNWYGLSLQVGLAFGRDITIQNYAAGYAYPYGVPTYVPAERTMTNQFGPVFLFQVGYTYLW